MQALIIDTDPNAKDPLFHDLLWRVVSSREQLERAIETADIYEQNGELTLDVDPNYPFRIVCQMAILPETLDISPYGDDWPTHRHLARAELADLVMLANCYRFGQVYRARLFVIDPPRKMLVYQMDELYPDEITVLREAVRHLAHPNVQSILDRLVSLSPVVITSHHEMMDLERFYRKHFNPDEVSVVSLEPHAAGGA